MFERLTDRARRSVVLAQEEARLMSHSYIGTEHLLLGLIDENEGVAARVLLDLGISLENVRHAVEEIIGTGGGSPATHIPFTPRAKKVLEFALREGLQLGHNYVGTEHILLGLIREGEGVAAQILTKLGVELDACRQAVIGKPAGYAQAEAAAKINTTIDFTTEQASNWIGGLKSTRFTDLIAAADKVINCFIGVDLQYLDARTAIIELRQAVDAAR